MVALLGNFNVIAFHMSSFSIRVSIANRGCSNFTYNPNMMDLPFGGG